MELERTVTAIQAQRIKLGIPKFEEKSRRWTKEEVAVLGTMPDAIVAQKLNRTKQAIRMQRRLRGIAPVAEDLPKAKIWTAREEKMLGRFSDVELAEKLGRTVLAVACRRSGLGKEAKDPLRRPWTTEEEQLLGKFTDEQAQLDRRVSSTRIGHSPSDRCIPGMDAKRNQNAGDRAGRQAGA
jgi:hypothetical protein